MYIYIYVSVLLQSINVYKIMCLVGSLEREAVAVRILLYRSVHDLRRSFIFTYPYGQTTYLLSKLKLDCVPILGTSQQPRVIFVQFRRRLHMDWIYTCICIYMMASNLFYCATYCNIVLY